jgi:hypothetical protein
VLSLPRSGFKGDPHRTPEYPETLSPAVCPWRLCHALVKIVHQDRPSLAILIGLTKNAACLLRMTHRPWWTFARLCRKASCAVAQNPGPGVASAAPLAAPKSNDALRAKLEALPPRSTLVREGRGPFWSPPPPKSPAPLVKSPDCGK